MNEVPVEDQLIDAAYVCDWLGTSRPTLKRLWEQGRFPEPYKVGKKYKFRKKEVDNYLANVKGL